MWDISPIDLVAVAWFVGCWLGYTIFAERRAPRGNLIGIMAVHREQWMMQMLARENRIVDTQIVIGAINNATFFASTSILILAGLFAVLGAPDEVIALVGDVPFAVQTTRSLWEIKVIAMMLVFVHGFFKFAWSMRQFNYCALLIGAAPPWTEPPEKNRSYAIATARVASLAAKHLNHGMRSYYFSMAALVWFVHPWLIFPATLAVVLVMYRREFRSRTLVALRACAPGQ